MNTSNKRTPKLLSLLLTVCMVLSLLPMAALAAETDIPIDEAHFPDEKFRTYVLENCDTDKNTVLSAAEAAAVTEIDVGIPPMDTVTPYIHSLQGISYFTNLSILKCQNNRFKELDLSGNPNLTKLNCCFNVLTSLDLSKNTELTELYCLDNHLTSLDLINNPNLNVVDYNGRKDRKGNEYTVNQRENITLPGNFDVSKVSNVVGGKFDTANNTFSFDAGVNEATYEYDTGYTGTGVFDAPIFKLIYQESTEPETQPTEPTPTEPAQNPFTDISTDEYFYEPVLWAVNNGITSGVSADKFGPSVNCTRGQIATFLWAAAGKPEPTSTSNPFTDVAESDYYYKAVLWAVEKGITSGMSADKFGPNVTCTRAQTVTFLWAAQGKPVVESAAAFSDVASGDYYYNAVKWAVENKVTAGVGGDRFGPSQDCLRGQIVTFLYKTFA